MTALQKYVVILNSTFYMLKIQEWRQMRIISHTTFIFLFITLHFKYALTIVVKLYIKVANFKSIYMFVVWLFLLDSNHKVDSSAQAWNTWTVNSNWQMYKWIYSWHIAPQRWYVWVSFSVLRLFHILYSKVGIEHKWQINRIKTSPLLFYDLKFHIHWIIVLFYAFIPFWAV